MNPLAYREVCLVKNIQQRFNIVDGYKLSLL